MPKTWISSKSISNLKSWGANVSPFSTRNIPKADYAIPDEEFALYKQLIENIPQNQRLAIPHTTKSFLQSLATKRRTWEDIKADMTLKGLKNKEYIHSIGKWHEYIKYLKEHLPKLEDCEVQT